MSYHPLTSDSGGDNNSRWNEAIEIIKIIAELSESLKPNELRFVEEMADADTISTKQLFWLRDIKDKYI